MITLIALIGFIGGFIFGQMVLYFLLRGRSKAELLQDQSLKWQYGVLNWGIALAGAYAFVLMYGVYFE